MGHKKLKNNCIANVLNMNVLARQKEFEKIHLFFFLREKSFEINEEKVIGNYTVISRLIE